MIENETASLQSLCNCFPQLSAFLTLKPHSIKMSQEYRFAKNNSLF